ncbi:hypothetical protein SELMODRAFT_415363 [Selaginella moellendorffii]|uniref:Uncharacterized protein n=1 Tax=Selaginella moellendorffii TaxID=88036 RepID=D8RVW0_SELML|nr:hypothetical protein SELMODRAFT_415363 [Selaginella moellendorffii]
MARASWPSVPELRAIPAVGALAPEVSSGSRAASFQPPNSDFVCSYTDSLEFLMVKKKGKIQNRTGLPFTAGVEICVRGSLYPYTSPLLVVNRGFTLLSLSLASAVRKVHGKRHFGAGAPKRQRERSKYHMRIRLACWQRAASGNQKGEKGLAAAVRLVRFPRES